MKMDYFKKEQYIAEVDKNDTIIGKIEKWEAHKKAILHRAFTLAVQYEDYYLLQHRKHPVFNSVYDITISSHQTYKGETLQSDNEAILKTLQREWDIGETDLTEMPTSKGTIYYQAEDQNSEYSEHEVCHIYTCAIKELKLPNFNFAYGFSLQKIDAIKNKQSPLNELLAPWVKKMLEKNML